MSRPSLSPCLKIDFNLAKRTYVPVVFAATEIVALLLERVDRVPALDEVVVAVELGSAVALFPKDSVVPFIATVGAEVFVVSLELSVCIVEVVGGVVVVALMPSPAPNVAVEVVGGDVVVTLLLSIAPNVVVEVLLVLVVESLALPRE